MTGDAWSVEIPLRGAGGEPVDLMRTFTSHGVASLPPTLIDEASPALTTTLTLPAARPRTVAVTPGRKGRLRITAAGRKPGARAAEGIVDGVRHLLRLDEDLSPLYADVAADPDLSWAAAGAGRMIRSQTVFEEVVKTICTTNCAWSGTVRMVTALVEHLGEPAPGAPREGWFGRAFPAPEAMAAAGDEFYKATARAGYRGPYLRAVAEAVAVGEVDLEAMGRADPSELPDEDLEAALLALPGVGPYAAAHIMMMLGRYSRLILDSWTRPTYLRIAGRRAAKDATILRRFRRYGRYSGLAFWLYLTRDWVETPNEQLETEGA